MHGRRALAALLLAPAYPFGYYTEEAERTLGELGIAVTFTTQEHCSRLQVSDRQGPGQRLWNRKQSKEVSS